MRDAEKRTGKAVALAIPVALKPAWNPVSMAGLHMSTGGSHRPLFQRRKVSAQVTPFLRLKL